MDETQNPAPASSRARSAILVLAGAALIALGVYGLGRAWMRPSSPGGTPQAGVPDGPPKPAPPWPRNAAAGVAFVGAAACLECHEGYGAAVGAGGHAHGLRRVDPADESLPATLEHARSGLRYEMRERDGGLWIRESLRLEDGEEFEFGDHRAAWRIGAGERVRAYVCEVDGYLVLSPVSYEPGASAWGMSRGYDEVIHRGFGRTLDAACLGCHVGRLETEPRSAQRIRILEEAIGCERCHGAGALHVERWRGAERPVRPAATADDTIVNPARLPRDQQMDVCAQCHMDAGLTFALPGRRPDEWRPGVPWNDVLTTYRPTADSRELALAGHVDELRASACFQGSDSLTCSTCHASHETVAAPRSPAFNAACLGCHDACDRTPAPRPEDDDCVRCHMPRTEPGDDPHRAPTSHRIGLPRAAGDGDPGAGEQPPDSRPVYLDPVGDASRLSEGQVERGRGLAYLRILGQAQQGLEQKVWVQEARKSLQNAQFLGIEDPDQVSALGAILQWTRRHREAAPRHLRALELAETQPVSPEAYLTALFNAADQDLGKGRPAEALEKLKTATGLRRRALDWALLAQAGREAGKEDEAVAAARRALEIWPNDSSLQLQMADVLQWAGQVEEARRHQRIGRFIHEQQSRAPPR